MTRNPNPSLAPSLVTRCHLCPGTLRLPVGFTGPQPSPILVIGEGPGQMEARKGYPFCGPTGDELDGQYLPAAGLDRLGVRVANAVCCPMPDWDNPPDTLAQSCGRCNLTPEIHQTQPEVIVTLGAISGRLFIPDLDLETDYAFPVWVDQAPGLPDCCWSGWVVPLIHPAAGLHESRMMAQIQDGFHLLGQWLAGAWTPPVDAYAGVETYMEITDPGDLLDLLTPDRPLAIDTENETDSHSPPYCLSGSQWPGTGWLVDFRSTATIQALGQWVSDHPRVPVAMHYAGHDRPVLAAAGCHIPQAQIRDTMMRLYHMGLPQGLKWISRRVHGMSMRSWTETVRPGSAQAMLSWMQTAGIESVAWWGGKLAKEMRTCLRCKKGTPESRLEDLWAGLYAWERTCLDMLDGSGLVPSTGLFGRPESAPDWAAALDGLVSSCPRHQQATQTLESTKLAGSTVTRLRRLLGDYDRQVPDMNLWRWSDWPDDVQDMLELVAGSRPPAKGLVHVDRGDLVWYACRDADATIRLWEWTERQENRVWDRGRG